ncbi:MAG: hypothetical protein ACJA2W_002080 [Planctomycetota bacterium]|jgi:hypothetical protein
MGPIRATECTEGVEETEIEEPVPDLLDSRREKGTS